MIYEWLTWKNIIDGKISYIRWDESYPPKNFPIIYTKTWSNNKLASFDIDDFVWYCIGKNIQVAWSPPHFTEYHYGSWKFYFKSEDDRLLVVLSMLP